MTDIVHPKIDQPTFADRFVHTQTTCTTCASPLGDHYYEVNGEIACDSCCSQARAALTGGSRNRRLLVATVAGLGAAFAGALLYYSILSLTGSSFGIVAIAVGFGVGKAVHWGSDGRGGWKYQTLAILLTYLSIVMAYAPLVVSGMMQAVARDEAQSQAVSVTPVSTSSRQTVVATDGTSAEDSKTGLLAILLVVGVIALVVAAPVVIGVSSPMSLVIMGVGLYQAWKLNQARAITITGPHAVAANGVHAGA